MINRTMTKKIFLLVTLSVFCLGGLRGVFAQSTAANEELFFVAQKAFDDGFYDVAIRYIDQYLQEYPGHDSRYVQVQLLLGQCYFFKNQYLKAYEIFQKLQSFSAYKDATIFWLGETYFKGSDFIQARKYYQQLIDEYPKSAYLPQAYYSLGWSYFDQGDYEKAGSFFLKLITQFPAHELAEDTYFKYGECQYNLRHYEQAVQYFQRYLVKYPLSRQATDAYFYLAESYYYCNDFLLAVTSYAKAADATTDPKIAVLSNISMGWSYLKLEKFELAEKYFRVAEKSAKENGMPADEVYLGLANLYGQMKDQKKALEAYTDLITQYPKSEHIRAARLDKATIHYDAGDYAAAVAEYQGIINQYTPDPAAKDSVEKAYFGIAWTYLKSGDAAKAIKTFEDIFSKTSDKNTKVSALVQIGDAYQDLGQFDKAISIYDRILLDFPDSIHADYVQFRQGIALLQMNRIDVAVMSFLGLQNNFPKSKYLDDVEYYLGVAYFKRNDFLAAIQHLGNYLEEDKRSTGFRLEARFLLGLAYFNKGDYAEALPVFQELTVLAASQQKSLIPDAEFHAAQCQYHLGQTKEAVKRFNGIIQKYPGTTFALEAQVFVGDHLLEQGDFARAIATYEQALNDFPGSGKSDLIYYELGQAYQAMEKFERALDYYKRIPQTSSKEIFAKAQLAVADIFSKKEEDAAAALKSYQTIAETVPEFRRDAYAKIALIRIRNKEYHEALAAYREALKTDQAMSDISSAELQFRIGDTYEMLNRPDEATAVYLKIPYLYSQEKRWTIKAYLRMARIFEQEQKWDEAGVTYKKILAFNTEESKYAQERLDWIKNHLKKKMR